MPNDETKSAPPINKSDLEKYSCAVTLSDMEIFVFPELLYSLVLANIMSPRLWAWRDDEWFKDIDKLKPYRRILRLKQFIIDHYEFNLDLDTWGLTTKEKEMARFSPWMDEQTVAQSNALFGYEGDKYYFTMDIRRHFGLDKYEGNVIPYWKTETIEAMEAFRHKPGFTRGAGECVSLSTLYAAALFVVCKIPLEQIFLMATPLHSQNFIDVVDGVLTNNRRIITKNMWFNGTEQTSKAQRALRNEQVTIVANNTGYIHCVYPEATIDPKTYELFREKIGDFLTTDITMEILANFLRDNSQLQKCFQIQYDFHGKPHYIAAEKVYAYEHASTFKVSDATREKLLAEIDEDEFFTNPLPDRMLLNKFDDFFKQGHIDLSKPEDLDRLKAALNCQCSKAGDVVPKLAAFAKLDPKLPDHDQPKIFTQTEPIQLTTEMTHDEITTYLDKIRAHHTVADLAFYALRDITKTDWTPFLKAAYERNPVSIKGSEKMSDDDVIRYLEQLPDESIYNDNRLAQPDEVWNYGRGDGLERAICLLNILKSRHPDLDLKLPSITSSHVSISFGTKTLQFKIAKKITLACNRLHTPND